MYDTDKCPYYHQWYRQVSILPSMMQTSVHTTIVCSILGSDIWNHLRLGRREYVFVYKYITCFKVITFIFDILFNRKVTVSDTLLRCLKKGSGDEQSLAARCLSILCVQLGSDIEEDFKDVHTLLITILSDNTAPVKARAEVIMTISWTFDDDDLYNSQVVQNLILQIFSRV